MRAHIIRLQHAGHIMNEASPIREYGIVRDLLVFDNVRIRGGMINEQVPFLEGRSRTDGGGTVVWQTCKDLCVVRGGIQPEQQQCRWGRLRSGGCRVRRGCKPGKNGAC